MFYDKSSFMSDIETTTTDEQPTVWSSLGCSRRYLFRTADCLEFSRLFATLSIQISRLSGLLSAVRDAIHSDQPTAWSSLGCSQRYRFRSVDRLAFSRLFTPQFAETPDKRPSHYSRRPFLSAILHLINPRCSHP